MSKIYLPKNHILKLIIDEDYIPWVVRFNCYHAVYPHEIEQDVDLIMVELIAESSATNVICYLGRSGVTSLKTDTII